MDGWCPGWACKGVECGWFVRGLSQNGFIMDKAEKAWLFYTGFNSILKVVFPWRQDASLGRILFDVVNKMLRVGMKE